MIDVTILGSTGSIGVQALDIIKEYPEKFNVQALSAQGSQLELLLKQAITFESSSIGIAHADQREVHALLNRLKKEYNKTQYHPEILIGRDASTSLAAEKTDVVLNAITGAIGLEPTLACLNAKNHLALANKESLIMGGQLVIDAATSGGRQLLDSIYPVDSEHSAIFQCLGSGTKQEVQKLILTASGGPFRQYSAQQLEEVVPSEALVHPTWNMGQVITVNSASLVNKGLEVIEASLLFDMPEDQIETVVHKQSIVHSMVQYCDGAVIAQASTPDMKLPISLGLDFPHRLCGITDSLDFSSPMQWNFEPVNHELFPAIKLARRALCIGKTAPAVYNASNEVAVQAFVDRQISFASIPRVIEQTLDQHQIQETMNLEIVLTADQSARDFATELIQSGNL